jgi:hypothetical protein
MKCLVVDKKLLFLNVSRHKKLKNLKDKKGCRLGKRRHSSFSLSTSAVEGVSGQRHALATLYPGTHCTGGWVGPRTGLDTEDRGKILSPLPGIYIHIILYDGK